MADAQKSYFRQITGAEWHQEERAYIVMYQRARVRLQEELELGLLHDADQDLVRTFDTSDDEVRMSVGAPAHFMEYHGLKNKEEYSRWLFADQLIKKVKEHRFTRLNLLVCPDNILIDAGMTAHFLHYGVKESIPPYEPDQDRVFDEVKAIIAGAIDLSESFVYYLKFKETMNVQSKVRDILLAKDMTELEEVVRKNLYLLERREKELVKEPLGKWKKRRNFLRSSILLIVPLAALVIYAFLFVQPKNAAYLASNESFMKENHGAVVETLQDYQPEQMPVATQYQLALSYIEQEGLSSEQIEQLAGSLTLESEPGYFAYWIHIGREKNEEAVDAARSLDERDLLLFALRKREADIRNNERLSGEEKQKELNEIQMEIEEYTREQKEEAAEENQAEEGTGLSESQDPQAD